MGQQQLKKPTICYGPYGSPHEALIHCQAFINAGFPPDEAQGLGIIWMEPAGAAVLRRPAVDTDNQMGASLLVQWSGPVAPSDPQPPSIIPWQPIEDAVRGVYERIGMGIHGASSVLTRVDTSLKQKLGFGGQVVEDVTGISTLLELRTAWRFAEHELNTNPEVQKVAAVASTVLDVIGVVGAVVGCIALAPAAGTVLGAVALVGAATAGVASVFLTIADGEDANLLLRNDDEAAQQWEHTDFFRRTELIAPLLVLPDAVRSGVGVAREVGGASEAARTVTETRAELLAKQNEIAAKIADQQAANAAKAKVYKGDRQKVLKLVTSKKNTVKKLRRANKLLKTKEAALRTTIVKSLVHDGPGLLSAVGGTALYVGHLPEMVKPSQNTNAMYNGGPAMTANTPAQKLLPFGNGPQGDMLHYFTFSITATSPLIAPQ
jgi:hypothetical protein